MQSITIFSCLILGAAVLSVNMHPNGDGHNQRPPFGNGTFYPNETFPSHMNGSVEDHGNKPTGNGTFVPGNFTAHSPPPSHGTGGNDGHNQRSPLGNGTFYPNETFPSHMNGSVEDHGNKPTGNGTFVPGNFTAHSPPPSHGTGGNGGHLPRGSGGRSRS
ncbi:unnamed protein product [Rotaria socialis]|uniref:Uncharacterized protein n=2 Tax=Rotaria socialis TaxID=392032 RepID=A0A817QN48_9BILA|nr:unnamed protein product [Rotaria socialis]CAF3494499.1 unnamed protein product [Rotaria socialis]CAF3507525.1 unnamed protein product [Rotaria socialis]CAF4789182.1 unnamed protein product [Rotaria socialis]